MAGLWCGVVWCVRGLGKETMDGKKDGALPLLFSLALSTLPLD